ncbi:MAG: DUF3854 domain-containing protein [Chloroflexi bacterium]|nr:DUF3854 domain-containing protein [Chloroflexota bacterium]
MPAVSAATRDRIYRGLLAKLSLSDTHRSNLSRRGLTNPQVDALRYATLPAGGRRPIVHRLISEGFKMAGVPGFYLDRGEVRLAGPAGMLIPVKDTLGRIVGLQVRCDNTEGGKYKWVSSAGRPYGCSPGAPAHVVRPYDADAQEIWITEGALKADIAAMHLNRLFVAVSGVGNWHGVLPVLKELKPRRIIICFDTDKNRNSSVRLHLDALTTCLVGRGLRTFEADWDSRFKGIDDLLTEV